MPVLGGYWYPAATFLESDSAEELRWDENILPMAKKEGSVHEMSDVAEMFSIKLWTTVILDLSL